MKVFFFCFLFLVYSMKREKEGGGSANERWKKEENESLLDQLVLVALRHTRCVCDTWRSRRRNIHFYFKSNTPQANSIHSFI